MAQIVNVNKLDSLNRWEILKSNKYSIKLKSEKCAIHIMLMFYYFKESKSL